MSSIITKLVNAGLMRRSEIERLLATAASDKTGQNGYLEKYIHYKGNIYVKIGNGIHTETNEKLVFYFDEKLNLFARPIDMFYSTIEHEGKILKRFEKI